MGALDDLDVDSAGNLYYLSGTGAIYRVFYQGVQITTQPASQAVSSGSQLFNSTRRKS